MAKTNFAALQPEQKLLWAKEVWRQAVAKSVLYKVTGNGPDSIVQRITELVKAPAGDKVVIQLLAELVEDGVTDDHILLGNEEAMRTDSMDLTIDQLRHAVRNVGRMNDQRGVLKFRNHAKSQLADWLRSRLDQIFFLTASGIPYNYHNNGSLRAVRPHGQNLADLAFAANVLPPTSERHLRVNGQDLDYGDTSALRPSDTLGYRHIVQLKAYAKEHYIRGAGEFGDLYHMYVTPTGMAQLRLDPDFLANVRHAQIRGSSNELFKGIRDYEIVDGVVIHEHQFVFNNSRAEVGQKWGQAGDVVGQRVLFLGAQAIALADIDRGGIWEEESFDYNNASGISYGKIFGMTKTNFLDKVSNQKQDFGVVVLDTAMPTRI